MESPSLRRQFEEQGYVLLPGFLSTDQADELRAQVEAAQPLDPLNTRLDKGELLFRHNLFQRSAALQEFISNPHVLDLVTSVSRDDLWVRWDQAVLKRPGGTEFPWHQDNGYNGLRDGHFQLWIALSDMKAENGGLWVQPGSHRAGVLPHARVGNHVVCLGDPSSAVSIDAKRGDVIVFSSLLLHSTTPNITDVQRLAYVVEYMSLEHFDPFVAAPYFVVAREGRRSGEWVPSYEGSRSLRNQLSYLGPRTRRALGDRLRGALARPKEPGSIASAPSESSQKRS